MSEEIKLSRVASRVHAAEWKAFEGKRDHPGAGGVVVVVRGGLAAEFEFELGWLGRYLRNAGDISARLRILEERTNAEIIGEIVQVVEAIYGMKLHSQQEELSDRLVEELTRILHGIEAGP